MNSSYLKYLLKSKKSTIVVVSVIYVLIYVLALIGVDRTGNCIDGIISTTVVEITLAYIMVPIINSFIHNKKAVDSYFSLPVSRKEMAFATQLFTVGLIVVPYIVLAIANYIVGICNGIHFNMSLYLPFAVLSIIASIIIALFNSALFIEANNTFDGVVMILSYGLIPFILLLAIGTFLSSFVPGNIDGLENIINYLSMPYSLVMCLANLYDKVNASYQITVDYIPFVICVLSHIVVVYLSYKNNFVERKTERAETISDRFFSYPFVIHAYVMLLVSACVWGFVKEGIAETIILYGIIFICYLIASFVYKRKIKIEIKNIVYFAIVIALAYGISGVAIKTRGFGLADKYDKNPDNAIYNLYYYSNLSNDYVINRDTDNYEIDEIDDLVKKAFPTCYQYNATIDCLMLAEEMPKQKNTIRFFEDIREDNIEKFYGLLEGEDINDFGSGSMFIENNFIEEDTGRFKGPRYERHSYDVYHLAFGIDDLMNIEKHNANIRFEVYLEPQADGGFYETDYHQCTFDELLELANKA